jgi:arsenate reductase (glutaredoxin)
MIVIHHNPDCGTSRNTLEMIRASGAEPVIIEYLKIGWTKDYLKTLFAGAGISAKSAMRVNGTAAAELGLTAPDISEEQILDQMVLHPVLVNRPFVVSPKGIKLCRPSELVLDLLDEPLGAFTKEDGEVVRPKP